MIDRALKETLNNTIKVTKPGTPEAQALTVRLLTRHADFPEASLNWAEKLIRWAPNDNGGEDALNLIFSAVAKSDNDKKPAIILVGAAKLLQRQNLFDKAESVYKQAIAKFPDDMHFKAQLGKLYLDMGKPKSAITLLEQARGRFMIDDIMVTTLANAYMHDGRPQNAVSLLRPIYNRGNRDSIICNNLGNALIRTGNPDSAILILKPLYESGKADKHTVTALANAYIHDGRNKAAVALLRQVHNSADSNEFTAALYANALIHDNKTDEALQVLKPFYNPGTSVPLIVGAMARACVHAGDRRAFDEVSTHIQNPIYRDYLDAMLLQAEHKPVAALSKLTPHIQGDIAVLPKNVLTLYASLLDDGQARAILPHMQLALGNQRYEELMESRRLWQKNPLSAELYNDRSAQIAGVHELAGVHLTRQSAAPGLNLK